MRLRSFISLTSMMHSSRLIVSVLFFIFNFTLLLAQEEGNQNVTPHRNGVGVYVGLLEFNLNYERNIFHQSKSFTNARLGIGSWTDLQSGGKYMNGSIVQLIGKKKSKVELDLGFKLILSGTNLHLESPRTFLIPDIYLGYYYESQESREYFRVGLSFPSLINIGGGLRF